MKHSTKRKIISLIFVVVFLGSMVAAIWLSLRPP